MNYYGDKISDNMALTPESFLICSNVPIGRVGWMDYLGQEIPPAFGEQIGVWVQVYRSPEELFSANTIASFEGKSVTNTHPTALLDINSTPMTERGHVQNVRRDGDFLVADLFIKDAGLISEVQNNIKREVSSGYNCSWHKIGDGKYEQREITGNHVAVVPAGRAGPSVAIMDAAPGSDSKKPNTGGKKKMGKMSKSFLTALGFKAYAADADPEDIAKAMDAMSEEDDEKKPAKDADPVKEPAKDADPAPDNQAQENAEFKKLSDAVAELKSQLADLKKGNAGDSKESADSVMDAIEKDLDKPAVDAEPDQEDKKEPAKDAEPAQANGVAADSVLRKFVQDMKPVIMAIPDEKARLEAAKSFKSAVQDARSYRATNGYGSILQAVATNKHAAMDSHSQQVQTVTERAEASAKAWNAQGDKMKGGK